MLIMARVLVVYDEAGMRERVSGRKVRTGFRGNREAAKDTDWVTKIAHDVGKKCP
jgi:hypothetical protein